MPFAPLIPPRSTRQQLKGLAVAIPITTFLTSSLLAFNVAQTCSLVLLPFSRRRFQGFNRWAANTWWGWCVTGSEKLNQVRLVVTGDPVPPKENALVFANHQQMPDITFLMAFARSKDRLGDLKWFVKHPIKYVPGVGWGMIFLNCLFIKRNWSSDQTLIDRTFSRIIEDRIPLWLISFFEGTRATPDKVKKSQQFASKAGIPPTEHVLVPRTKGFVASVQGLREHLDAIYDITIGYPEGVPTLWQYVKGFAKVAHFHVRRYPMSGMPHTADELSQWLYQRYHEKDQLLEHFRRFGHFPSPSTPNSPSNA